MKAVVLIEPNYKDTYWCRQTMTGISSECVKKRYECVFPDNESIEQLDWDALYGKNERVAIIIGTSVSWIPAVLKTMTRHHIRVILVSLQPPPNVPGISSILVDHQDATQKLLVHIASTGCRKIALYGINPNSSADLLKAQCFPLIAGELGLTGADVRIYYNYASLRDCFIQFQSDIRNYDAVLCANDIVAVSFIKHLNEIGLHVPEDILVASYGDTLLSRITRPTLTTAALNHEELGKQAVSMFTYLSKNSGVTSSTVKIACKIQVRESTRKEMPEHTVVLEPGYPGAPQVVFYSDPEASQILEIEAFLSKCDDLDLQIIHGMLEDTRYSDLAEQLYLSENTVKYRVKRMMSWLSAQTKDEFLNRIICYLSEDSIENAADLKKNAPAPS